MRSAALALLAWAMVCIPVLAHGGGLEVFPQAVEMQFPQGYDLYSDAGKLLKSVPGPTSATVQAKTSGKTFAAGEVYLSDWSYDQLQQGKQPNWIVPKSEAAATAVSQVAAPSGASAGLIVYPTIKEMSFPEGYSVFSDDGKLIKTVPGPTSIALKGEIGGKNFANGTAYLSDWSYEQQRQGKSPNWVVGAGISPALRGDPAGSQDATDFVVYPTPRTMDFPLGYDIYEENGQSGRPVVKATSLKLLGESTKKWHASEKAYFDQWRKDFLLNTLKPMHWIVAREPTVYANARTVQFPNGYRIFSTVGESTKTIVGPASANVIAEIHGMPFTSGVAYLELKEYAALQQRNQAKWIVAEGSKKTFQIVSEGKDTKQVSTVVQEAPKKTDSIAVSRDRTRLAALSSGLVYLYDVATGLLISKITSGMSDAKTLFFDADASQVKVMREVRDQSGPPRSNELCTLNLDGGPPAASVPIAPAEAAAMSCENVEQAKKALAFLGDSLGTWNTRMVDLGRNRYAIFDWDMAYTTKPTIVELAGIQYQVYSNSTSSSPNILRALQLPEELLRPKFEFRENLTSKYGLRNWDVRSDLVSESIGLSPYSGSFFDQQLNGFVVTGQGIRRFDRPLSVKQVDGIGISEDASKLVAWGIAFQNLDCKGWYDFYATKTNHSQISMPTIVSFSDFSTTELPTGDNIVWNCSLSPDGRDAGVVFSDFGSQFLHYSEVHDEATSQASSSANPVVQAYRVDTQFPKLASELHGAGNPNVHRYTFENYAIDSINALHSTRIGFRETEPNRSSYRYLISSSENSIHSLATNSRNESNWELPGYRYEFTTRDDQIGIRCNWKIVGDQGDQQTIAEIEKAVPGTKVQLAIGDVCSSIEPLANNVMLISDATGMYTFDTSKNQVVDKWSNPSTGLDSQSHRPTQSVAVARRAERIFYLSDDSSIHMVDYSPDGKLNYICRFYMMGNRVPLFMLPDNSYATIRPEKSGIHFVDGKSLYPLEQFDFRLNRPDIVLDRLGAPAEAVAIAKQLREKRLKRMGVTEEMLKPDFHVPELEIVGDVPATTDAVEISLSIKASDSKYPLERLKVYVNNVPVNGRDGESLRDQNSQSLDRTIPIKLAAGRNKIQVSVLNNAGAESLYANAEVSCTANRPKPTLYAVAMGVSEYSNPDWNLKYAAKDARDVLARLKDKAAGQYGEVKELLLSDKEVTKDSIAKIKEFVSGATIDDTVLMFAAGHGLLDSKYDYYFGTTDIDFNNPSDKGIAFEDFDDILADLPCLKKSLLVDTCHAGELDQDEKTLLASADSGGSAALPTGKGIAMRSIGTRGMNVKAIEGARGASEWYDRLQGLFVDLRRGSGSTILTSAAGAEYALESSEQQNGLFTYAVLEALDGKKDADTNKDGSVQMSELGEYVKKRVSELTNNKQTPNTRRVNLEGDFTLAKTR
jgi:Caspase domain